MAIPELGPTLEPREPEAGGNLRRTLLLLSMVMMLVGGLSAPLFTRIYFLHGGTRLWLQTFLQNCGFLILFPLLCFSYFREQRQRRSGTGSGIFSMTGKTALVFIVLGVVWAFDGYMYAYGSSSLPLSTSSLLTSTQVAFTAAFAFVIVRQRFTPYSINSVVLMVTASIVLGLQAGKDRPPGVSQKRYLQGFFAILGSAAVFGILGPLMERTWMGMKKLRATHVTLLEMQVILSVAATGFCAAAMLINKEFQAIAKEAQVFDLGETKYRLVLAACAISWQFWGVGFVGVIICSSSLLAGILFALFVPLGEVLPVLVLHEKFNGGKGVSMALALWGFISYLYGEYRQHKREKQTAAEVLELPTNS